MLLLMAHKVVNAQVQWFSDHHSVVCALQVDSRKLELHAIAQNKFSIAVRYYIHLKPVWVLAMVFNLLPPVYAGR